MFFIFWQIIKNILKHNKMNFIVINITYIKIKNERIENDYFY